MKYLFNNDNKKISERICDVNGVSISDINDGFIIDYDQEPIKVFVDKLFENKDKRFLIVGDYDCDGICATTIIKKLLDNLNIKCNYYIPSRSKDGYGLNNRIVDNAYENKFDCLFLLDNGVSAQDSIDYALEKGIITYIIDHHEYNVMPKVFAFLHPNLLKDGYKDLCAGGLCQFVSSSLIKDNQSIILGGLATIADSVTVLGYNRYLIKKSRELLKTVGYKSIISLSGGEITYKDLQFNVIPKINSVSRVDDFMNVNYVVKYLLDNDGRFEYYLSNIEAINNARKEYSKSMYERAIKDIDENDNIIVISSPLFKEGLCGLVANRIMNQYHKAVLVFSVCDDEYKGSGRAPKGCNLYDYLKQYQNRFSSFGGHAQAVGISINKNDYQDIYNMIKSNYIEYYSQEQNVLLINQDELNNDILSVLDDIMPFGPGFEQPLFALKNPIVLNYSLAANKYPKYTLNNIVQAISFNTDFVGKRFDYMIGYIQKDDFRKDGISFLIEDLI